MVRKSKKRLARPFVIGCNVYTEKTYEDGFADAFEFIKKHSKFIDKDTYRKMKRYLRRKKRNAYHHFKEEPTYYGAQILGMKPDKKFVTIDAWVTRGVNGRKKICEVAIDAECMILCECGHCLTRQEARGTDPFIMKPEDFERKALKIRQSWGH
jgi:hypothetical protein